MDWRNQFPDDEHTDLTPRIVLAQRRANLVWLVGAIGALVVAGGIAFVAEDSDKTTPVAVEIEAERIAAAIDSSAKSAHVRADGVAMTPMVRAAIETDAATMDDIAKNEIHLALTPGETLEMFQIRGTSVATLLRWPADATPLRPITGHETRLENSGKSSLDVVAASPIQPQGDHKIGIEGEVELSVPVDLALTRQRLSALAVEASLIGVGEPLVLVANKGGAASGAPLTFPVQPSADWKLPPMTLAAAIANKRPRWITPARYTCVALSGMLLLLFLFGLRRH
jgi:hypothetical protein